MLYQVYTGDEIKLGWRETLLINYGLSGFEEVSVVRSEAVLINTNPAGFGDSLIYVESVCISYLRIVLMGEQADSMPNFVHLLLTRASHTMNVLKVH